MLISVWKNKWTFYTKSLSLEYMTDLSVLNLISYKICGLRLTSISFLWTCLRLLWQLIFSSKNFVPNFVYWVLNELVNENGKNSFLYFRAGLKNISICICQIKFVCIHWTKSCHASFIALNNHILFNSICLAPARTTVFEGK